MTSNLCNNAKKIMALGLGLILAYSFKLQASAPAAAGAGAGAAALSAQPMQMGTLSPAKTSGPSKIAPARIAMLEEKLSARFKKIKELTAQINQKLALDSHHEDVVRSTILSAKDMIQSAVEQRHIHPDSIQFSTKEKYCKPFPGQRLLPFVMKYFQDDSQLSFVQFLLEHGATIEHDDLLDACSVQAARLLMHHGASLQKLGAQALYDAAQSSAKSSELVQLYIDQGIDPNMSMGQHFPSTLQAACIDGLSNDNPYHSAYLQSREGYNKFMKDKENRCRKIEILLHADALLMGPNYNIPRMIRLETERLKDLNSAADVAMFEEMEARSKRVHTERMAYLQTGLPKDLALCKSEAGYPLPREIYAIVTLYYSQKQPDYEVLAQMP